MPEGPEIRRSADKLNEVLQGQFLEKVEIGLPSLQSSHKDIVGQKVLKVTSWGKAMLIHLENALSIYSHNQLYGVWRVSVRDKQPETSRSLRLGLHTVSHSAVLYSASDISIWPTQGLHQQPLLSKLGPDVLCDELTIAHIKDRLSSPRFCKSKLSSLFLNQHFIAGIGNYLRSEILFFAGLHPDVTPRQLSCEQLEQLAKATHSVCRRSYATGGYTVDETRWREARLHNDDFEASRFMVFDREQLSCRECSYPIERINRNGRRLYLCLSCQPGYNKSQR